MSALPKDYRAEYLRSIAYIRAKVDQMLALIGTLPLRQEELDDNTLIELDPIGIVTESFGQILSHLNDTNRQLDVARQEIRAIFDSMDAGVVVINDDGTIDDCNRQAREWLFSNRDRQELIGAALSQVCPCDEHLRDGVLSGALYEQDMQFGDRYFHIVASDITDAARNGIKKVIICFDITRQKQTESSLTLYGQVFETTAEGIAITDRDMRFVEVNDAYCRITGYPAEELLGKTPRLLRSGHHDGTFYREIREALQSDGHWQGETLDRARDGSLIPLLQSISVVRNEQGEVSHYITLVTDISAMKETQARLDFLAHHDPLTELPNRLLFTARLEHAIDLAARNEERFGVLFIDLDRFKTINDSLGHQLGDRLLIDVAQRLGGLVRKSDTIARLGGDEFVVLLERIHASDQAERLAEKLVDAMRKPFYLDGMELHLGCSIGITMYPEDGRDAVTLLKNADAAMYRVKDSGRDGYCKFSQDLSEAVDERLALENALRHALREEQLELHYQPVIDMEQRRIVAVEALSRWRHPERGLIPPDCFIPIAEDTKLILPLGEWVARKAIGQFRSWRDQGVMLDCVSINTSGIQLFRPGFVEGLLGILKEYGVEGRHLQIELTENVLMQDVEVCRAVLTRLRDEGIRIAIDDFGTGYSSLAYLKQLPIDMLKIDRSFVSDVPDDPNDCAIVEAIVALAYSLDLVTIAEGVETDAQEFFLRQMGCHRLQGYRYSRPIAAGEFADFVKGFPWGGFP
ncbi:PAS domain S-box protein [Thioalkalivibrio denitrificans]|uniref:cyclic-guanylate-specific phosphodiesterase n=1 Tax=Thioalkalivibrio denitrificans TaxID=108003 RepID=A0A1V3NJY3_9GAMM|nr:EAL domain-containing protein [Thioalkalivibrio denitrificans]OOG25419.1 PAS domain S-box protein [Thioalkalivibrio denitrificans]